MSEKTPGERSPGTPSQRALGAMESAVRRARERTGVATGPGRIQEDTQPVSVTRSLDDLLPPPTPPTPSAPPGDGTAGSPAGVDESARREHLLAISIAVVAALVVVAGVALAYSAGGGGQQGAAPPPSTPATTAHSATPPASHNPPPKSHGGGTGAPSTTTTTATPATPGGPPVIASLSPASGAAGQGIQVAGSNFLSSSGQIVASFNGQVTSTSCPAQNTCTVTVPPQSGSSSAQVTITTASGTSNAVIFTYS